MKRGRLLPMLPAAFLLASGVAAALDLFPANGSFEAALAGGSGPQAWKGQVRSGRAAFGYDTSGHAVEGRACVWLSNTDPRDIASWTSKPFTLQPGRRYRIGLWYRCTANGQPEVLIAGNDFYLPTRNYWSVWQKDFVPDEKHAKTTVTLWLNYRPGQKVYFDAVAVAPVDALPQLDAPADGALIWRGRDILFRWHAPEPSIVVITGDNRLVQRLTGDGLARLSASSLAPGAYCATVVPTSLADELRIQAVAPSRHFFISALDAPPAWAPKPTTPPMLHALTPVPDSRCDRDVTVSCRCFTWAGKPSAILFVDGRRTAAMSASPVGPAPHTLPTPKPVTMSLTYRPPSGATEFQLRAAVHLTAGPHILRVVAHDSAGNGTAREWTVFAAAAPQSRCTIGNDLLARFNGRRLFPMGLYCYSHEKHIAEIEAAGFDSILSESRGNRDYLDALHACGLKILLQARGAITSCHSRDDLTKSWLRGGPVTFKDHPALLAYWTDEVEGSKYDPKWVQEAQRVIRQLDPNHPLAACLYSVDDFRPFGAEAPVLFPDIYPVPNQPVIEVAHRVDAAYAAVARRKPVWLLPQAFDWRVARTGKVPEGDQYRPTGPEMKCMAWLGIVRGAKAIEWWASDSGKCDIANFPDRFRALCDLTRQIRSIDRVLFAPQLPLQLRQSPPTPRLLHRAWRLGRETWLAVINPDAAPWAGFISSPALRPGARVDLIFENKTARVTQRGIGDLLEPLAVHIYRITPP